MKRLNRKSANSPFKKTWVYTILSPLFYLLWGCQWKCLNFFFLPFNKGSGWVWTMMIITIIGIHSVSVEKWRSFYFLQYFIQKLTWMLWKHFRLGNYLPTHIKENTYFFRQKSQQLLSAEANFEGCLLVKDYMTMIHLLYCMKRESWLGMAILSNKCNTFSTFINAKHKVISSK